MHQRRVRGMSGGERRRTLRSVPAEECSLEQRMGALVGQALDDLEAERLDVPAALMLTAMTAWREGCDSVVDPTGGVRAGLGDPPDATGYDYIVVITDPASGEADAQGPFDPIGAIRAADRLRLELDASGLPEFTITLTQLRRPVR